MYPKYYALKDENKVFPTDIITGQELIKMYGYLSFLWNVDLDYSQSTMHIST